MGTKLTVPLWVGISNLSMVVLDGSAEWWNTNGSAFEAYNASNIADYAVAGTEHGDTAIYEFTFPSGISVGQYTVYVLVQAGASLAESDFPPSGGPATVEWDGSAFSELNAVQAKTDNLPSAVAKNVALSNFSFLMVDSDDHFSPVTGLTVTAQISKDGGAFAGATNSVAPIANGVYKISFTQAEMNADVLVWKFTATGADQRTITVLTDT